MTTDIIRAIMIQAMKEKDYYRKELFQLLLSNAVAEEKKLGRALTPQEVDSVLAKEKKQMEDSIAGITNRPDFTEPIKDKIDIVNSYLPKQIDDVELLAYVFTCVERLGKNKGILMREITKGLAGRAEGRRISQAVDEAIK